MSLTMTSDLDHEVKFSESLVNAMSQERSRQGFLHLWCSYYNATTKIQMCNKHTCRGAKAVLGMCDFVSLKIRLCCQSN